ncbi:ATP-binding cassette domain-containing protein [Enterococcus thailandicus]|uniref:Zinc ABC transporter ATP-binding protein n=1 Tax=Enterococcus thailandicus TaxID=417368 RepID=A0A179EPF4_ENTTH|nr:ATP-binding cassette domain-containing protein [Enterococcus thailandicus]OAQ55118.1 zinc ABC transporter ATP-binding protein [Enterococcus thailandicus]
MIEIKNLKKKYTNNQILNELNYTLKDEIYVLYGKNGVGKTTLMNLLTGIEFPDSGEIKNESGLSSLYLEAVGIGMSDMSIRDNIKLLYWLYGERCTDEILELLSETLYSKEQLDTEYALASLGMKLKVGLSLLYAAKEWGLIVLDETLSGIDPQSKKVILEQLKTKKCPVIIVSHNFDNINSYKKIELTKEGIVNQ